MSNLPVGVEAPKASLLTDSNYFTVLKSLIDKSRNICLASLFIIDLKTGSIDTDMKVYQVLKALKNAQWRGVEVKLLIGGSRDNVLIAEAAEVARYVALNMGISCKWLTSTEVRGSHNKMVIADNFVLIGSHNWSAAAFTNQIQDSIVVESAALAAYCQSIFYRQWNRKQ